MKEWWPRIIILALLAVVLGVPFLMKPRVTAEDVGRDRRIVIVSPHNEQIRFEIERAFNKHREDEGLPTIDIDWRSGGGTSDLRKQVLAEYESAAHDALEMLDPQHTRVVHDLPALKEDVTAAVTEQGIGYDLFFGGGEYEHSALSRGVRVPWDTGQTDDNGDPVVELISISASVPANVPDELMQAAFPQPTIGGEALYHPDRYWIGAALSNFGIVYNRDVLQMLDLPEPKTWSDLKDPRYQNWIALSDPGHSGSIAATYNTIVRRTGWTEGWALLRRVYANARYFTSSSSKVPVDVSSGEAAAGMCIDFYGRYQAGEIGGNRVGFVAPRFMTATTADPISVLRGAPNAEVAHAFVRWTLSEQAQTLWQKKRGTPEGPEKFELRRLPIRSDLYEPQQMQHWADQVKPFDESKPLARGMPDFYFAMAPVSHAMAIDIHDDLKAAWGVLNIAKAERHPELPKMLELFDAMPEPLQINWPDKDLADNWATYIDDPDHPRHAEVGQVLGDFATGLKDRWRNGDQALNDRVEWTLFFRENYRQIVELSK